MDPIQNPHSDFPEIRFNIILSYTLGSPEWSLPLDKSCMRFSPSACALHGPPISQFLSDYSSNIWREAQTMEPVIIQFQIYYTRFLLQCQIH